MWKKGTLDGYVYEAKVYAEGSVYGINGGKISKLQVKLDDRVVANYDRGWDLYPAGGKDQQALARIVAALV